MQRLETICLMIALFAAGAAHGQSARDWSGPSVGLHIGHFDIETSGAAGLAGDGPGGGGHASLDYDLGGYVIGGGISWDVTERDLGSGTTLRDVLRLGARAGVDSGPNWYYGTVGLSRASMEDPGGAIGDSDGYFFGLGYEVYLERNATVGAEILHQEFESFDLDGLEARATTLNLSLNLRF